MKTLYLLLVACLIFGCGPKPDVPSETPKEPEDTTMVASDLYEKEFYFKDSLGQFTPDSIRLETSMDVLGQRSICNGRPLRFTTRETVRVRVGTGPIRPIMIKCITTTFACKGNRLMVVERTERYGFCESHRVQL